MTLELQIVKETKSEDTPFVLVEYNGEINKRSSNFNLLDKYTDVCNNFITGLDFLEHGADYETAISATGESYIKTNSLTTYFIIFNINIV